MSPPISKATRYQEERVAQMRERGFTGAAIQEELGIDSRRYDYIVRRLLKQGRTTARQGNYQAAKVLSERNLMVELLGKHGAIKKKDIAHRCGCSTTTILKIERKLRREGRLPKKNGEDGRHAFWRDPTCRQFRAFVRLVGAGAPDQTVADQVGVSPHKVRYYAKLIADRFGADTFDGALDGLLTSAQVAEQLGIVTSTLRSLCAKNPGIPIVRRAGGFFFSASAVAELAEVLTAVRTRTCIECGTPFEVRAGGGRNKTCGTTCSGRRQRRSNRLWLRKKRGKDKAGA